MATKKCSNCFQVKPVSEFYRKLDGYQSRCKACNAEVVAGYNDLAARMRASKRRQERKEFARLASYKDLEPCIFCGEPVEDERCDCQEARDQSRLEAVLDEGDSIADQEREDQHFGGGAA